MYLCLSKSLSLAELSIAWKIFPTFFFGFSTGSKIDLGPMVVTEYMNREKISLKE